MADTVVTTIQAPSGRTYKFEHPADASDADIQAYGDKLLKQYEPESNYQPGIVERPKPESHLQGFEEGVGKVAYNVARLAETGADALGIKEPLQKFGEFINPGATSPSVNDAETAFKQRMDAMPTQGSPEGRFTGEVAATLPTAMLPGGVLVQGGAAGALLTDARTPGGVALDAATGAASGFLGDRVLRGAAAVLNPNVSADVATLVREGVRPTTGQIAGSVNPGEAAGTGRIFKKAEDVAASVPVAGAAVQNAQYRGVQDLNRAAANRALRAIGERAPQDVPVGHDLVRYTGDRLSNAYNEVLPQLNGRADRTFAGRVQAIAARADLPPGYEDRLQSVVNEALRAFRPRNPRVNSDVPITADQIGQLPPTQWDFNGRRLRDASERLGDIGAAWRASDDPYNRILGDVAQQLRDQLHALARRENPGTAGRLRDIDRGYASLVRLERAASGTADGVVTPRQYDAAVRGADRSARRRQSARGRALDQDLSGAASRVMANSAAQGGSKDVNSLVALGVLGQGAVSGSLPAIGGLAAVGAGSAAYTQTGQAALRALMTRQAGPLSVASSDVLRRLASPAGIGTAALVEQQR